MMTIKDNKLTKAVLGSAVVLLMASCSDWTETESVNIKYPDLKADAPELSEQYTQSLRDYRNSDHKVVIAKFDNKATSPAGQAEHINVLLNHVHLDVTHGLDGIGVEQNTLFPAHSANFRNGLNRADFIVGEHHSHQAGVIPNGIPHLLSSDDAVFVYIQQGDFKALRSELVQGV